MLIRPGAIGDSILGFPALEHLKTDYTEVWVRSEISPLVKFADRVRPISETGLHMLEIRPAAETLAQLGSFCEIHSWYGAKYPEFREAVRDFPFRFHEALPVGFDLHAADFFAAQVGATLPAIPRIKVEAVRHDSVVIHPFSGSANKNWPYEMFLDLSRRIPVEWAADRAGNKFDDLHELARWLAGARVFVGNDSGITHLAAAVGTPVVALFCKTDPGVWGPRGERVRTIRKASFEEIDVDEVLHAIDSLL